MFLLELRMNDGTLNNDFNAWTILRLFWAQNFLKGDLIVFFDRNNAALLKFNLDIFFGSGFVQLKKNPKDFFTFIVHKVTTKFQYRTPSWV